MWALSYVVGQSCIPDTASPGTKRGCRARVAIIGHYACHCHLASCQQLSSSMLWRPSPSFFGSSVIVAAPRARAGGAPATRPSEVRSFTQWRSAWLRLITCSKKALSRRNSESMPCAAGCGNAKRLFRVVLTHHDDAPLDSSDLMTCRTSNDVGRWW